MDFAVRADLDIYTTWFDARVGIELKYKTSQLSWDSSEGEPFKIQSHGAHDPNRWLFLNDIQRLEYAKGRNIIDLGFAVLWSNDPTYWTERKVGASRPFSLHQGGNIAGERRWSSSVGPGTKAAKNRAIQLAGNYTSQWEDYSLIPEQPNGKFRYLAFDVVTPNEHQPWGEEAETAEARPQV